MRSLFIVSLLFVFTLNSYSQFGKNKVQYRTYDWKYIESKHFDIYYYDSTKALAEFTAIEGENAVKSIQKTLNYNIDKRIPIIIYNSKNEFQQTNVINSYLPEGIGGVTELYKNRVVLPFLGNMAQFKHVIHHELVHAVLNEMFYGGSIQSALTRGNLAEIPIWMNEGLAEYESIGGLDAQTDMFMRDMALNENLTDLQYIDGYSAYRVGQAFYWYISEKYGEQRVGDLLNRLRITNNLNNAFKGSFNMSVEDVSDDFKKWLKRYYLPDIGKFKDPDDFAIRLTNAKKEQSYYNSSPSISPNGKFMAFISAKDRSFGIYVMDLDNKKNTKKIISSFRSQDFEELNILSPGISWDPTGKMLAISAKAGGEDAIYLYNVKEEDYEKITLGISSITSVTWSPDGNKLAFIGTSGTGSDLYLYDMKIKRAKNLTNDFFSDGTPVWSWDSKYIYFISDRGKFTEKNDIPKNVHLWEFNFNQTDIYSYDVSSSTIKRITNDPQYNKTSLVVSPDNRKILYVSDKNGIMNIYQLDLESGHTQVKTNSLTSIAQLSITPDGKDLLFSTMIAGGSDIYHIKDPFSKNLETDTIPVTRYRESDNAKSKIDDQVKNNLILPQKKDTLIGYGNFDIEFSRQKLIKPNPDVIKNENTQNQDNLTSDTTFVEENYKVNFSTDLIMSNPSYDPFYQFQTAIQMMFSDVLSNHQIYASANFWIDLKNSNIMVAYSYLPDIIDYNVSVFHSSIMLQSNQGDIWRFRNWGLNLKASYPFDLFRRLEWGINWDNLSKEYVDGGYDNETRMLFIPEIKYVYDDALWGYSSPIKGSRYFVDFKGSPKLTSNGLSFAILDMDLRHYIPITDYITIALRGAGGMSLGPNKDQMKVFVGGTENWINMSWGDNMPFVNPEDFLFEKLKMPLRGFPINVRSGTQYFITNTEIRFPLIQALIAGPLPVLFHTIMGSVFMDLGGAWSGPLTSFKSSTVDANGTIIPNDLLMSLGLGVRSFVLGLPLKLDIAWRNEFNNWSEPFYMVSLGFDF